MIQETLPVVHSSSLKVLESAHSKSAACVFQPQGFRDLCVLSSHVNLLFYP